MGGSGDGYGPESIVHSTTSDDDLVLFDDINVVLSEERSTVIITKLSKRDKSTCLEVVKHKGSLGSGRKMRRERELANHGG